MIIIASEGHDHIGPCLESIGKTNRTIAIARGPGYDFGKYRKHSRGQHLDTLCMHDSARVTDPSFIERGFDLLKGYDIVAPYTFMPNHYDSEQQRKWVQDRLGLDRYRLGIFGPIFFARAAIMEVLQEEAPEVTCKMEQQGMERGLGVMATCAGWRIHSMGGDVTHSFEPILRGACGLSKVFPQRS